MPANPGPAALRGQARGRRPTRQKPCMALPRSLNRLELALPQTLGEPVEREALAALSQHKLNALGMPLAYIDRQPALPLRQQGVPRLAGQAGQRRARPRGHRGPRPRCLPALPRLHRRGAVRRADGLRAAAGHAGPAVAVDPRRLLPRPQRAGARPRLHRHLQRRRQPEAPRARGRAARAPSAPRHRQRRPADPVLRPPAEAALRQQAVRRLDRRAGRRRARPRAEGIAAGRRAGGNAGLHRARVRRRHGVVRAARAPVVGRIALDAHHALPRPRGRRPRRRRVRR